MVTEQEREELGRLTNQKMKAYSHQQQPEELHGNPGRLTTQNLESLKHSQKKRDTQEAKVKLLLDRMMLSVTTGISSMFSFAIPRNKEDRCQVYGHNLPFGSTWSGPYPKCADCGAKITDSTQLRGALPKAERERFRGYSEK